MRRRLVIFMERAVFLMTAAVALAAIFLQGPRLLGMTPYVVLSGSMEPKISAGSVLYCKREQEPPEVGDIITYRLSGSDGSQVFVTHRVIGTRDGAYLTKGDHNGQADLAPVSGEQILGVYRYHIPWAGYVVARLNGKLLAVVILWILFLNGLSAILSGFAVPTDRNENEERRAGRTVFLQDYYE